MYIKFLKNNEDYMVERANVYSIFVDYDKRLVLVTRDGYVRGNIVKRGYDYNGSYLPYDLYYEELEKHNYRNDAIVDFTTIQEEE